jgi:hypothetical protein
MKLILMNVGLVVLVLVTWGLLTRLPKLDGRLQLAIGVLAFCVAACILTDFAKRSAPPGATLGESYGLAALHTLQHAAWPLVLNVFFVLGFAALYDKFQSVPMVMGVWLLAALIVPSVLDWKTFTQFSLYKWLALVGLLIAVFALWRDSIK